MRAHDTKMSEDNIQQQAEELSDEDYIQQEAKELSDRLHRAVGKFTVTFERLCDNLRNAVAQILATQGLDNRKITDILIGDMTIFPLQSILRALIIETQELSQNDLKIVKEIFRRIGELAEERNRIIHSAWYINYKSQEDILSDVLTAVKPGYSKKGAKPSPYKYPLSEIEEWTEEAQYLSVVISQLGTCIYVGHRIEDHFEFWKDKYASALFITQRVVKKPTQSH